jgi:hypothetical protein
MGFMTENEILKQSKKAQGETNAKLDRIAQLLEEQNTLLRQLVSK